jgi:molybdopterin-guanine dinucleotide biosynthesis protein A
MTAKALADLRLKGELSQKATYFEDHNIPLYLPNSSYVELFLAQAFQSELCATASTQQGHLPKKSGPSIKALLKQIPHQAIQSSDANVLFNTNTPEQWQQAKQQLNF